MIPRRLYNSAVAARDSYPAILVTGPRQSGKTTFVKACFSDLPYVNLESPLERADFESDPLGFLARFPDGAIFDEVQYTPKLLSYLQVRVDEEGRMGRWVLTGSQQIELVRGATQSMAGRVSILELLPFAQEELPGARRPRTPNEAVLRGGYPPLHHESRGLEPSDWLENYLATFVQRDVAAVLKPRNPAAFDHFLRVCATRTGQELNKAGLAEECEVDQKTIGHWLGTLEQCYVIRLLRPHHANFRKRLVKRPKLYFLDSGLACRLLHIADVQQLATHPLRGALFETWCYTEVLKHFANRGRRESLWYWRSSDGIEIDLIVERGREMTPIEIKAGRSPSPQAAAGIGKLRELSARDDRVTIGHGLVIYGGNETRTGSRHDFIPWNAIDAALEELR